MLYIFDLDGTLTEFTETDLYPDVIDWFEENKPEQVAIATNQGGVGLRYWMEPRPKDNYDGFGDNWERLPTMESVYSRLITVQIEIEKITGYKPQYFASFRYLSSNNNWSPIPDKFAGSPTWSASWRKPNPGMLLAAARKFKVPLGDCLMIGDDIVDKDAAANAGMSFQYAVDFFKENQ